jgi:glucose-6-phosphate 1-epimerase
MPVAETSNDPPRKRIPSAESLRFEPGNGGLPRLVIATPHASIELYLHGAHLTAWHPRGQSPVIFTSAQSLYRSDKAIRGGVPICFPWFGLRPDKPQHGFARTRDWKLDGAQPAAAGFQIDLSLKSDDQTRAAWPHEFIAHYRVTIGPTLNLRLEVTNTDAEAFTYEDALHAYFSVGDVRQIAIHGLANTDYLDKTADGARRTQTDPLVRITGEVDRLYFDTQSDCIIDDPTGPRRIRVAKTGSNATVVWNPDAAKAKAMPDFGEDEWRKMVCVETANAGPNAINLPPGHSHVTEATLTIER